MCVRPIVVKDNVVPCGKCFECKKQDRMSWTIRVQDEIKQGLFVTLTYAPEHYKGYVCKKDLQDYMKRLRYLINEKSKKDGQKPPKIKYFGVGEYGGRFGRGHLHIIINTTDTHCVRMAWKKGIVHIGRISNASIHYCTKYVQKSLTEKKKEKGKREFRLMSKSLGLTYLKKNGKHHKDNMLLYRIVDGKKYILPRYYTEKIFGKQKDKEYRLEIEKLKAKHFKKLSELYFGLLKKEIDELKIKKYIKQLERFQTLEILNSINIKKLEK